MSTKHKIVIVGTGFGGMYAMKSLSKALKNQDVEITIIGKDNYFLFTPMLHEVATGVLSHHNAAVAIRELLPKKGVDFFMAEVAAIDRAQKVLHTSAGDIAYDTLILATGAKTQFFNVAGAEQYGFQLKTLQDALRFREHVISLFEQAMHETDQEKRRTLLSIAVVGAGPTGVELIAETAELVFQTIIPRSGGRIQKDDVHLYLLHRGSEVLGMLDPGSRQTALANLREKGVDVRLDTEVVEVTDTGVRLGDGTILPAATTAWVAGVKAVFPEFIGTAGLPTLTPQGRIIIDNTLRIPEDHAIYVLGDTAQGQNQKGEPLPMLAQVAMRQGKYLGRTLSLRLQGREPVPFAFHNLGELVSVGQWRAVGNALGVPVRGPLGWMMWKMVYLTKFVSLPKAIKISLDWLLGLVSSRDISLS